MTSHYDKVLVQILDSVNQQQALEGGQVLAANRIPPESVDDIDATEGFTVHSDPSLFNYVGLFNTQRAPLDNPLVRQALAYATPYEDIIEVAPSARPYRIARRGAARRLPLLGGRARSTATTSRRPRS